MPEEGKTDSESSCSFFGKRKAVTRKNALCLRRKRNRKAVVSSSKKEKRLSERMNFVCRKYALRPLGGAAPFCPADIFPVSSGKFTGQDDKKGKSGQDNKIIELTSSRNCIVHQQRNRGKSEKGA